MHLVIRLYMMFATYGWIMLKKLVYEYGFTPLLVNGISVMMGGAFSLLHSYAVGENWNPLACLCFIDWLYLAGRNYHLALFFVVDAVCIRDGHILQ